MSLRCARTIVHAMAYAQTIRLSWREGTTTPSRSKKCDLQQQWFPAQNSFERLNLEKKDAGKHEGHGWSFFLEKIRVRSQDLTRNSSAYSSPSNFNQGLGWFREDRGTVSAIRLVPNLHESATLEAAAGLADGGCP